MTTKELVELDTAVLIAKYGLTAVIEAISSAKGISLDQLRERIARVESSRTRRHPKAVKTPDVVIEDLHAAEPRKTQLKAIASLYQSRRIFPNLRDVTIFLRRHGVERRRLKSRNEAFRALATVLSSVDEREIKKIMDEADRPDSDDFAMLANRLMGGPS
jgi:hypothetical protein